MYDEEKQSAEDFLRQMGEEEARQAAQVEHDAALTPKKAVTLEDVIKESEDYAEDLYNSLQGGIYDDEIEEGAREQYQSLQIILGALRMARDIANPQTLTLDELTEMAGEPVYIVVLPDVERGIEGNGRWELLARECPVDMHFQDVNLECGDCYATYDLGKTYNMYAHEPKEG